MMHQLTKPIAKAASALALLSLFGCASGGTVLVIPERARYADDIAISRDFANCKLEQKMAKTVKKAAGKTYDKVTVVPYVKPSSPGMVLTLQITGVSTIDRALFDQRALTVRGVLYEDGKEVGDFYARRRSSRRGLQIRSTCDLLGNSIDEIGDDLEKWFKKPVPGARLGDL